MIDPVKTTIELTPAQAAKHVASFGEVTPRLLEVTLEKTRCREGDGHHLGVSDFALEAFLVATSLEPIISYAVHCGYFGVHRIRDREGSACRRTFNLAGGHRFFYL